MREALQLGLRQSRTVRSTCSFRPRRIFATCSRRSLSRRRSWTHTWLLLILLILCNHLRVHLQVKPLTQFFSSHTIPGDASPAAHTALSPSHPRNIYPPKCSQCRIGWDLVCVHLCLPLARVPQCRLSHSSNKWGSCPLRTAACPSSSGQYLGG